MPSSLIPIANDPFGNLICINSINNNIYFWDHEKETDSSSEDNIYKIAENLTDFLKKLRTEI